MTKVTLSNTEKNLVLNRDMFLTKIEVINKVYLLFKESHQFYSEQLNLLDSLPKAIKNSNGKISRGENYLQLPWVMLDAPNYFKGSDVFAVRTFFWWGNFISINFLVMGCFVEEVKKELIKTKQRYENWNICINENPWQHHFNDDNFIQLNQFTATEINDLKFIKLAKKVPLQEWDNIEYFLNENFQDLIKLIAETNYRAYEKAL